MKRKYSVYPEIQLLENNDFLCKLVNVKTSVIEFTCRCNALNPADARSKAKAIIDSEIVKYLGE